MTWPKESADEETDETFSHSHQNQDETISLYSDKELKEWDGEGNVEEGEEKVSAFFDVNDYETQHSESFLVEGEDTLSAVTNSFSFEEGGTRLGEEDFEEELANELKNPLTNGICGQALKPAIEEEISKLCNRFS